MPPCLNRNVDLVDPLEVFANLRHFLRPEIENTRLELSIPRYLGKEPKFCRPKTIRLGILDLHNFLSE